MEGEPIRTERTPEGIKTLNPNKSWTLGPGDRESWAFSQAFEYLNKADERARERFVYTLVHKYFPDGLFDPDYYKRKKETPSFVEEWKHDII